MGRGWRAALRGGADQTGRTREGGTSMSTRRVRIRRLRAAAAAGIFLVSGPLLASGPGALAQPDTASPIQHVIVVIGENHSFDNVFGTYTPGQGQSIDNLLSKGIVKTDGSPGPTAAL